MKVSLINGVYILPDAISYCIQMKVRALKDLTDGRLEYRIFCYGTNTDDANVRVVRGSADLANDPFFLNSDIAFFEFGIYSDLFNAIFLLSAKTKKIVTWHNITPERLLADPKAIESVRRGFAQRSNLRAADFIFADSTHNRDDLVAYGIRPSLIEVLPIPLKEAFPSVPSCNLHKTVRPVHALFVGRFVPSKGLLDSVEAVSLAIKRGVQIHLTLIGDLTFSDPAYISEVRAAIAASPNPDAFLFAGPVSDQELVRWYYASDVLLIASYHEGFGVPVIEGLACGCIPVTYDAGNLPDTVHGLGRVVGTGDRQLLAEAIVGICTDLANAPISVLHVDCGAVNPEQYSRKVAAYLDFYSYETFLSRFEYLMRDRLGIHGLQFPLTAAANTDLQRPAAAISVVEAPAPSNNTIACYLDLRVLQDCMQDSAAARFLLALVRHRPVNDSYHLVALVDPEKGEVPDELTELVDDISSFDSVAPPRHSILITVSSVWHGDPLPWLCQDKVFTIAISGNPAVQWISSRERPARSRFLSQVIGLKRFDAIVPLTLSAARFAASALQLPAERILFAGELSDREQTETCPLPGDAFVVRADFAASRVELVARAFRSLMARQSRPCVLRIAGTVNSELQADLRRLAGDHHFAVEFVAGTWIDIALECFAGAIACIVPSAEPEARESLFDSVNSNLPIIVSSTNTQFGFNLPASSVFADGDADHLAACMSALIENESLCRSVAASQKDTVQACRPPMVIERVWDLIRRACAEKFGSLTPGSQTHSAGRPLVWAVWPTSNDKTDSLRAQSALRRHNGLALQVKVSRVALCAKAFPQFCLVLYIAENSSACAPLLAPNCLESGILLLRETFLPKLYSATMAQFRDSKIAARFDDGGIGLDHDAHWLHRHRRDPLVFVRPLVKSSAVLAVQSRVLYRALRSESIPCYLLPEYSALDIEREELTESERNLRRSELNVAPASFAIAVPDFDQPFDTLRSICMAIEFLRGWHIPGEVYFVGDYPAEARAIRALAAEYGISTYIHFTEERRRRDLLIAADAAIQLRLWGVGQTTLALLDCIAAGLPTVANDHLADSCEAPSFIRRVPTVPSSLLLAEQLASLYEIRNKRAAFEGERSTYRCEYNADRFLSELVKLRAL